MYRYYMSIVLSGGIKHDVTQSTAAISFTLSEGSRVVGTSSQRRHLSHTGLPKVTGLCMANGLGFKALVCHFPLSTTKRL